LLQRKIYPLDGQLAPRRPSLCRLFGKIIELKGLRDREKKLQSIYKPITVDDGDQGLAERGLKNKVLEAVVISSLEGEQTK
jgi:hypothetical protein